MRGSARHLELAAIQAGMQEEVKNQQQHPAYFDWSAFLTFWAGHKLEMVAAIKA